MMSKKRAASELHRVCSLLGVPFDVSDDMPAALAAHAQEPGLTKVYTPNPEILMTSLHTPGFRDLLAAADVSLPDGNGLFWATTFLHEATGKGTLGVFATFLGSYARLVFAPKSLRKVLPRLHHGSDTFFALHEFWNAHESPRIFYFGGEPDVVANIIPVIQKRYPRVRAVGSSGVFPFRSKEEFEAVLQDIETARAEVVFVAMSFPKQEQWIAATADRLEKAGVRLVMACGGTLDFAVGKKKRAPLWMHRFGLEWLWRLLQEPARLGRIWTAVIIFPLTILRRRLAQLQDLS